MLFHEYGNSKNPAILLIHGGGTDYWLFEEQAELLAKNYFVILPVLDGHGKSASIPYLSTKVEALKIKDYVKENCGGKLLLIGGASLGAQIALEVMGSGNLDIAYGLLESGVYQKRATMSKLIANKPMIKLMMTLYKKDWAMTYSFKSLGYDKVFYERFVAAAQARTYTSNFNLYNTYFNYNPPLNLGAIRTKVLLIYGGKEKGMIKKDAAYIASQLPVADIREEKDMKHCAFSLNHPKAYTELIDAWVHS